jgi:trehalose synthase-fused probable maltokinase
VREQLRMLTHAGFPGKLIRTHGDYHLGQTMWAPRQGEGLTEALTPTHGDWVVLDFEGEPARSLAERRRKRSPLRDVAGMLRSFAYAANGAAFLRGIEVPDGWEEEARREFLDAYLETVDPGLLPAGQTAIERILAVFELEKAVYELRYELDNRPDWVQIPVAGIQRLIEHAATTS